MFGIFVVSIFPLGSDFYWFYLLYLACLTSRLRPHSFTVLETSKTETYKNENTIRISSKLMLK
jgi:hypothetical protein